ncbi:MAG TPA: ABC transporter ATP-binding protein [Candidatus Dormibacteraeota bacterium]
MSWLVDLTDVSKVFSSGAKTVALDGVTLRIGGGEFTAVMGPSGSGKSTLLNLIAGLDRATSGSIVVDGVDLTRANETQLARYRRSRVGFVFQFFNLLSNLTVMENVLVPAELAGVPGAQARARAKELLKELGMAGLHGSYPSNLSGGQRQRVAIARALINRPALVLADEPTGALDSGSGEQVMALLDDLNQRGQTILLVTHDAKLAAAHGRRIVTLRDGRVEDDARIEPRRSSEPRELVRLGAEEA